MFLFDLGDSTIKLGKPLNRHKVRPGGNGPVRERIARPIIVSFFDEGLVHPRPTPA
jgi:hypothetical protein